MARVICVELRPLIPSIHVPWDVYHCHYKQLPPPPQQLLLLQLQQQDQQQQQEEQLHCCTSPTTTLLSIFIQSQS